MPLHLLKPPILLCWALCAAGIVPGEETSVADGGTDTPGRAVEVASDVDASNDADAADSAGSSTP